MIPKEITQHILHLITFCHFVFAPLFWVQKKCAPCPISLTYTDRLHTFLWQYYILFLKKSNKIFLAFSLLFSLIINPKKKIMTKAGFSPCRLAFLFCKSITYKRTPIISCHYYNISTLSACGFKNRESSILYYICFRTVCFCLD